MCTSGSPPHVRPASSRLGLLGGQCFEGPHWVPHSLAACGFAIGLCRTWDILPYGLVGPLRVLSSSRGRTAAAAGSTGVLLERAVGVAGRETRRIHLGRSLRPIGCARRGGDDHHLPPFNGNKLKWA